MSRFNNGKITSNVILYDRGVPQQDNNFVYRASANYNMMKQIFRFNKKNNNICSDPIWDRVIEVQYSNLNAPHEAVYSSVLGYTYIISTNINTIYKINNNNSNDISIVASSSNGLFYPIMFEINSTNNYAFVANFGNSTITRINLLNNTCENLIINNINNVEVRGLNAGTLIDDTTMIIACCVSNNIVKIILDSPDSLNATLTKFGDDILTPVDVIPYDSNGNMLVTSYAKGEILLMDSNGNKSVFTSGIAYPRMFSSFYNNYIFVSASPTDNSTTSYIIKINKETGKIEPFIPNCIQKKYFNPCRALNIEENGYMYIANQKTGFIYKIKNEFLGLNE
jgi:DNA-binding beta-propeller fold protein YncE